MLEVKDGYDNTLKCSIKQFYTDDGLKSYVYYINVGDTTYIESTGNENYGIAAYLLCTGFEDVKILPDQNSLIDKLKECSENNHLYDGWS